MNARSASREAKATKQSIFDTGGINLFAKFPRAPHRNAHRQLGCLEGAERQRQKLPDTALRSRITGKTVKPDRVDFLICTTSPKNRFQFCYDPIEALPVFAASQCIARKPRARKKIWFSFVQEWRDRFYKRFEGWRVHLNDPDDFGKATLAHTWLSMSDLCPQADGLTMEQTSPVDIEAGHSLSSKGKRSNCSYRQCGNS